MTHHLNKDIHEQVHRAHVRLDGMHSARQIKAEVRLADFQGKEHRAIVQSRNAVNHQKRGKLFVELTVEVCVECGYIMGVVCHHGLSYWTHRPGCPRYDQDPETRLPIGLVAPYSPTYDLEETLNEDCEGCLLLCPVCKADGT